MTKQNATGTGHWNAKKLYEIFFCAQAHSHLLIADVLLDPRLTIQDPVIELFLYHAVR